MVTDNETQEKASEEAAKEGEVKTGTDTPKGDDTQTGSLIDRADASAKRLKAENDRKEELLKREEEIVARRRLGGETEGAPQEAVKKEETPAEYKDRVMRNEIKPSS